MSPTSPLPPPLSILSSGRSRLSRKVKIGADQIHRILHLNKLLANSTKRASVNIDMVQSHQKLVELFCFLKAIDCNSPLLIFTNLHSIPRKWREPLMCLWYLMIPWWYQAIIRCTAKYKGGVPILYILGRLSLKEIFEKQWWWYFGVFGRSPFPT